MEDTKNSYAEKLLSAEAAMKLVESGDVILANPVAAMPNELLRHLAKRYQEIENVTVHGTFVTEPFTFMVQPEVAQNIRLTSMFMGPLERKLYNNRLFNINSINFSDIGDHIKETIKPDWFLLQTTEMDEAGFFNVGPMGVAMMRDAMEVSKKVVIQVNREVLPINQAHDKFIGANHVVHISEVDYIVHHDERLTEIPAVEPTTVERRIAEYIVPKISDGATLQVGFGGLANAVSLGLSGKVNDLAVHTEMVPEAMVDLINEKVITRNVYGGFAMGSQRLYEFVSQQDEISFGLLSQINKPKTISEIDDFVSINACLMVDLTGQITSEGVGTRQVSAIGGAGDFVRGATHSLRGQSFLCVTATNEAPKTGKISSNIVFSLPAATPVTIPRHDVMYVVTEYGIADLFNQPLQERAKRLIAIAHPDFREELTAQAVEAGILR